MNRSTPRCLVLVASLSLGLSACLLRDEQGTQDDLADQADSGGGGDEEGGVGEDGGADDGGGGVDQGDPLDLLDLPDELANYAAIELPAHYAMGGGASAPPWTWTTPRATTRSPTPAPRSGVSSSTTRR